MTIDPYTGAGLTIDYVHSKVHDSRYFRAGYIFMSVASSATVEYIIDATGNELHCIPEVVSTGLCVTTLLEDVTATSYGTTCTNINMNREKIVATTVKCYHTPTAATGTVIGSSLIEGAAGKVNPAGGASRSGVEFILYDNIYMIRAINLAATATSIQLLAEWYEH